MMIHWAVQASMMILGSALPTHDLQVRSSCAWSRKSPLVPWVVVFESSCGSFRYHVTLHTMRLTLLNQIEVQVHSMQHHIIAVYVRNSMSIMFALQIAGVELLQPVPIFQSRQICYHVWAWNLLSQLQSIKFKSSIWPLRFWEWSWPGHAHLCMSSTLQNYLFNDLWLLISRSVSMHIHQYALERLTSNPLNICLCFHEHSWRFINT